MRIFIFTSLFLGALLSPALALAMNCTEAAQAQFGAEAVVFAECAVQCSVGPSQTPQTAVGPTFVAEDCSKNATMKQCCVTLKEVQFGQEGVPTAAYDKTYGYESPLGDASIPNLIGRVITQILPLIGSLFLVLFLWGGFLWLTSNGDETRVKKARGTLTNAVIGMAIIIGAYTIVAFLLDTLGSAALG
jgi:hypothetical protein